MKNYCSHLYDDTTDRYVQIVKLNDGKIIKIKNTNLNYIKEITQEFNGQENVYITPNTIYVPFRRVENIRQFRALFLDFDNIGEDKHYVSYNIFELAAQDVIPMPTMIVDSGRGLHVYWRIKNAPYGALYSWQEIEDMLYHRLKHLGADRQATDATRLLRLPNTINSKSNSECNVLWIDDKTEYSMYDLKDKYIKAKKKPKTSTKTTNKVIANAFFNSYSLHMDRATDLITLCELRKYKVEGHRNMLLHCYAYWIGIYVRSKEELADSVNNLNNKFKPPLKQTEVNAILRCVPKAIDKFIAYEQGIRNGEDKRVSKGMKDKAGYWYKNETLIERLGITVEEQRHLKTIIGTRVKYDRNNEKRKNKRRNENGLTPKQQELQDLKVKILELRNRKMKNKEIADKLSIPLKTLERHISSMKKEGLI